MTEQNDILRPNVIRMRDYGMTFAKIGENLGISQRTAQYLYATKDGACKCGREAVAKFKGELICAECLNPHEPVKLNPWSGRSATCCTE